MADPVTDFVSPQNLFNIAQGEPAERIPVSASDASQGIDAFMPPSFPQNAPHLPRRYISFDVEPSSVQQSQILEAPTKLLTKIIREKESSDNYQAVNPKSTASGAYQYTDSTWNGYGGYSKAALAPPAIQDRKFQEDIHNRLAKFGGDPYKAIAAHYLPALANDPTRWDKPFKVHGRVVKPVIAYIRYVTKGTPLEAGLDEYLANRE